MTNANDKTILTQGQPHSGLTKREYFAAMAMNGYIASYHIIDVPENDAAEYAVRCADALILELNKQQP
jgi:hypothetical protein